MHGDDGSERRLEALFAAHARPLLDYAMRRAPTRADAADVVSETMLAAWRRIHDVPVNDEARLWLFGVARGVLANQHRSQRRRLRLGERLRQVLGTTRPTPPTETLDNQLGVEVHDALERLSDDDREVIYLAAWEQLSSAQIASVIGVSPGAARNRLHRARERLRSELNHHPTSPRTAAIL